MEAVKKNKRRSLRLYTRILAALLGICAFMLALLWLMQVVFLDSIYRYIKTNALKSSASLLIRNIENEDLDGLIERVSLSNDQCIELLADDGTVIYSHHSQGSCMLHRMGEHEKTQLLEKTASEGGELLDYYDKSSFLPKHWGEGDGNFVGRLPPMPSNQQKSLLSSTCLTLESGDAVTLTIETTITPVDATVTTLRLQLTWVSIIMIVLSIIISVVIARGIAKPIEQVNEQAKGLAKGDYDEKFAGKGYKEIEELSGTLNFAAKELGQTEMLRRELIANVSHDLRTPLTLIEGYAEAMRDLPEENNQENAQIIIDEAKRLTMLVSDMLALSKIQAGIEMPQLERFDLNLSLQSVCMRLNEFVRGNGYKILYESDGEAFVNADDNRISQAVYNLIINAVNHIGSDKTVYVSLKKMDGMARVSVIDHGSGIKEEMLPFIWEKYFRAEKPGRDSPMGTGLGLSIVKSIMDMHGMEYGVSTKLGEGSEFYFLVALSENPDAEKKSA